MDIPYDQYAADAYQRMQEIAAALAQKQKNATGMLGGKPAAMGETYMTGPAGISGRSGLYNDAAASQAFDATQNLRESELEDMQRRYELMQLMSRKARK